jgi:hypothetical protein
MKTGIPCAHILTRKTCCNHRENLLSLQGSCLQFREPVFKTDGSLHAPLFYPVCDSHWTYWLQILSELCFQRVALSGNYDIVAISTDKNTFFNDLDYKTDLGQHFHKSEKSARRLHRHKIIKTNLKTLVSTLLTRPQGSQGCQKMRQDPLNMPVEVWCAKIAPKLKNI